MKRRRGNEYRERAEMKGPKCFSHVNVCGGVGNEIQQGKGEGRGKQSEKNPKIFRLDSEHFPTIIIVHRRCNSLNFYTFVGL